MSETMGRKILCLSDIKATDTTNSTLYTDALSRLLGSFDRVLLDSDPQLVEFSLALISRTLSPFKKMAEIRTCPCGAYEELGNARMFDLRRVADNTCSYCEKRLEVRQQDVLLSDIVWPEQGDFTCNQTWSNSDLRHFLGRQTTTHKISKEKESIKLTRDGSEFGIRYQIIWSAMIVYLTELENDTDVTLHYVHKVQDKVFFICSLAKMMRPDIHFYLKALPIVWLEDAPLIPNCSLSQVKLLSRSLGTKKKELKVSLKSWRYQKGG
jgi:hypothetical protein